MDVKHIGVFGKRNAGKSSLINFLLQEDVAIVSNIPGTTTDPVKKRLEIFGVGPVNFIDTAGYDDEGEVGIKRVDKTKNVINNIDLAIFLYTGNLFDKEDKEILLKIKKRNIPLIVLHNQSDVVPLDIKRADILKEKYNIDVLEFSCNILDDAKAAHEREGLIKVIVNKLNNTHLQNKTMLSGLFSQNDLIVLVCPIDNGAPTGRMILPQVMAIRDILDGNGVAVVLQPDNLQQYLQSCTPKLVVTDSQAFGLVQKIVPQDIPLTSFSMLLARSKGPFEHYLIGTPKIANLRDGASILIMESCSHHKSCDDIGRVKLPAMFRNYMQGANNLSFTFVQGLDPIPNGNFDLAVQCGGCMVTSLQLNNRILSIVDRGIPVTNYGMAMAFMQGIYNRVIKPLV